MGTDKYDVWYGKLRSMGRAYKNYKNSLTKPQTDESIYAGEEQLYVGDPITIRNVDGKLMAYRAKKSEDINGVILKRHDNNKVEVMFPTKSRTNEPINIIKDKLVTEKGKDIFKDKLGEFQLKATKDFVKGEAFGTWILGNELFIPFDGIEKKYIDKKDNLTTVKLGDEIYFNGQKGKVINPTNITADKIDVAPEPKIPVTTAGLVQYWNGKEWKELQLSTITFNVNEPLINKYIEVNKEEKIAKDMLKDIAERGLPDKDKILKTADNLIHCADTYLQFLNTIPKEIILKYAKEEETIQQHIKELNTNIDFYATKITEMEIANKSYQSTIQCLKQTIENRDNEIIKLKKENEQIYKNYNDIMKGLEKTFLKKEQPKVNPYIEQLKTIVDNIGSEHCKLYKLIGNCDVCPFDGKDDKPVIYCLLRRIINRKKQEDIDKLKDMMLKSHYQCALKNIATCSVCPFLYNFGSEKNMGCILRKLCNIME